MRGFYLPLILAAACGPSGKSTELPKANKPLTAQDIVKRSSPAIVRVEAQGPEGEQFGTGFIVDKSGVVATNFHVIQGTSDIKIKLHDGTLFPVEHVLNIDVGRDLVIVKFKPEKAMPTLRIGDSNKVATGEKIVAIGNPLGIFEQTVSEGLISSIREICSQKDVDSNNPQCPHELHLLQISAPISQGSSGGPLFNQVGEVVGITTAIIAQGQLINFAMPANYLKPRRLREGDAQGRRRRRGHQDRSRPLREGRLRDHGLRWLQGRADRERREVDRGRHRDRRPALQPR
jgi:S1-C subfamily serine protease